MHEEMSVFEAAVLEWTLLLTSGFFAIVLWEACKKLHYKRWAKRAEALKKMEPHHHPFIEKELQALREAVEELTKP